MEDIVRVGFVSSVDSAKGTARVYYPDRGQTTLPLQLFSLKAEYNPPIVGDQVIVLHLSNDTSSGIILGRFWSEADPPPAVDYSKVIGSEADEKLQDGIYTIHAKEIKLTGTAGEMTLTDLLNLKLKVDELERRIST